MKKVKSLPNRDKVKTADTWDLSSLFENDAEWEKTFAKWEKRIGRYAAFQGKLGDGAAVIAKCLRFDLDTDRVGERLCNYAFLKTAEDKANSDYQEMIGRCMAVYSLASQAASFIQPEILSITRAKMNLFLKEKCLGPYRLLIDRILYQRPHTLSKKEERLLAMQTEMAGTASQTFEQLTDADMRFGTIRDENGQTIELTHATFGTLMYSPTRAVRKRAFTQMYDQFGAFKNTLASTLGGSLQKDVYYARARKFDSSLEGALFDKRIPVAVYDQLIDSVRGHLPALYRYYELRRKKMKLRDIHAYDTYVPILTDLKKRHSWDQAVEMVLEAVSPLGGDYVDTLAGGLRGRWCDRYENRGKHSGAFSCGSYDGWPYILMNFQEEVLSWVFTLAHEAGHSMHSYYSAKKQPFAYHDYVIFVAEVASTFNEQLLSHHLLEQTDDRRERAYLINRQIDAIRSTIFRQTMFAEFEKIMHERVEAGQPPTIDAFKGEYRTLLDAYFGPDFALDEQLDLECLRIPHFYRAFYVYQYATGMSAALALSDRVLGGGKKELDDYLGFLGGGCSKDPLELLRGAGVDMEKPEPVESAMRQFESLVDELEELL
jgi:oligoendopeptidase F